MSSFVVLGRGQIFGLSESWLCCLLNSRALGNFASISLNFLIRKHPTAFLEYVLTLSKHQALTKRKSLLRYSFAFIPDLKVNKHQGQETKPAPGPRPGTPGHLPNWAPRKSLLLEADVAPRRITKRDPAARREFRQTPGGWAIPTSPPEQAGGTRRPEGGARKRGGGRTTFPRSRQGGARGGRRGRYRTGLAGSTQVNAGTAARGEEWLVIRG